MSSVNSGKASSGRKSVPNHRRRVSAVGSTALSNAMGLLTVFIFGTSAGGLRSRDSIPPRLPIAPERRLRRTEVCVWQNLRQLWHFLDFVAVHTLPGWSCKDNGKNDSDYWRIEWLRPSDCRNAFKLWA